LAHEHINSDLSRLWLLMTLASMREVGDPRGGPIRGRKAAMVTRPYGIEAAKRRRLQYQAISCHVRPQTSFSPKEHSVARIE
jgi:hypothetical protein